MRQALISAVEGQKTDSSGLFLKPGQHLEHTRLIQDAIDKCARNGGGKVVLTAGNYHSGTIILRSGITLHLDRDASLVGSANIKDYFQKEGMATALLFADGAKNIGLTGGQSTGTAVLIERGRKSSLNGWKERNSLERGFQALNLAPASGRLP